MSEPQPEFSFIQPGDVGEIVRLFERSFGRRMTDDYYRWEFIDTLLPGLKSVVARVNGKIVSHAGYTPRRCRVAGRESVVLAKHTSMTDPDWRGKGIYSALLTWAHERLAKSEAELVLSWPNTVNHTVQASRKDYREIWQIPAMRRYPPGWAGPSKEPHFPQIKEPFASEYDELCRATGSEAPFGYVRSAEYLTWRYAKRPDIRYFLVEDRAAGKLRSAAMAKLYPPHQPNRIMVVEWLSAPDDPGGAGALDAIEEHSAKTGMPVLLWQNVHLRSRHRLLEKRGYAPSEPVMYFGAFPLGKPPAGFDDFKSWHVSMGDVDIF